MSETTKKLNNFNVLDETHNEATEAVGKLPGTGGEAYMKKARNLSTGERYLVLYDKYGRPIGKLIIKDGIVADAIAGREDVMEILAEYVGARIETVRSNRNDLMHGRPIRDCWL